MRYKSFYAKRLHIIFTECLKNGNITQKQMDAYDKELLEEGDEKVVDKPSINSYLS